MKTYLFILFSLFTQVYYAQVTKNIGDFEEISIFDQLKVHLIQDSKNSVLISGLKASEVEVINKNGVLKIRMPFAKSFSGTDCKIEVHFKNLHTINTNEGATLSCDSPLQADFLTLTTKEGAEIELALEVQKLVIKAVTGGKLYLSGSSDTVDCSIGTGGIVEAKELETNETNVSVSAGGTATIFATSLVDAKVRAGGSIFIHGNPKQVNKQTILGGQIKEIN